MDIQIHLTNGEVNRFRQDSQAKCESILKSIRPSKVFTQKHIVIQDNRSISFFACAGIEWVEFFTQCDPGWSVPHGPNPLMLLSAQEYETRIATADLEMGIQKVASPVEPVTPNKMLVRFDMRSGKKYFGEMAYFPPEYGPKPNGIYGKRNTQKHALHVIINPQNIIQWKVDCRPAEIRRDVWEASHKITL